MRIAYGGLLGLLLAGQTALANEVYRWVDEDGKVHFGDRPPLAARAENIEGELRPINSADATRPQKNSANRQENNLEQEYENRQRQRQREQQQQMARACSAARQRLRALRGRVAFIDESGKEVKMTERERQQMAAQLQGEIRRVCG